MTEIQGGLITEPAFLSFLLGCLPRAWKLTTVPARPCSRMEGSCCIREISMVWCVTQMLPALTARGYKEGSSTSMTPNSWSL